VCGKFFARGGGERADKTGEDTATGVFAGVGSFVHADGGEGLEVTEADDALESARFGNVDEQGIIVGEREE